MAESPTKKPALTDQTVGATVAHSLAHAARIVRTLAAKPDHPRKAEYAESLILYRRQWRQTSPALKEQVTAYVVSRSVPDVSEDEVKAALAALEG